MSNIALEEGLLLRVILEPDDGRAWRCFECWRELRGERGMRLTAWPITRLLPMVHRRLEAVALYDGWERNRLRGIHRKSLTKNTILWGRALPALRLVADHGHELMLVGGALHGRLHYPDPGARMLAGIDLVVRPGVISKIETLLSTADWNPVSLNRSLMGGLSAAMSRLVLAPRRVFRTGDGQELTVREDLFGSTRLTRTRSTNAPNDAWKRATKLGLEGLALLIPSPEDQVLMAALAATSSSEAGLVDPLLDLALTMRCAASVDVERVVALANADSLAPHLEASLNTLTSLTTEPDARVKHLSGLIAATPRCPSDERLFAIRSTLAPTAPEAVLRTLWERVRLHVGHCSGRSQTFWARTTR